VPKADGSYDELRVQIKKTGRGGQSVQSHSLRWSREDKCMALSTVRVMEVD